MTILYLDANDTNIIQYICVFWPLSQTSVPFPVKQVRILYALTKSKNANYVFSNALS